MNMAVDRTTPYTLGELEQACTRCDWRQARQRVELRECPRCGGALGRDAALAFGGVRVEFDGTHFRFRDTMDRVVDVDEADYPDTILFMRRHARLSHNPLGND
jgi:hypothetical protein